MVLMFSMFAVFAVSDYPSISPSPVRFEMLDGSCSLHPQPKPQKPSCRDKKPFRGRCVKCPGMVDESRRFSGWIPLCWWVLLSCFWLRGVVCRRVRALLNLLQSSHENESLTTPGLHHPPEVSLRMACIFENYRPNIRTNQESLFLYGCSTYLN